MFTVATAQRMPPPPPLAVLAAERLAYLPAVPTAREAGIANYEVTTWYVLLVPAGTPRDIIVRLNAEWLKLVEMPDTREKMQAAGYDPMSSTPEQCVEFIRTETVRWAQVIKDAKLRVE